MRIPHFIGGYVDLDGDGIFGIGPSPMEEMLNPALLTFPILGEYKQPLDAPAGMSPRPFSVTIAKAIEWMFRIRKWRAEVDIPSGAIPGGSSITLEFDLDDPRSPADELSFICTEPGHTTLQFYGNSGDVDQGDFTYEATAYLDLFIRVGELENPYAPNDATWEPYQVGTCTDPDTDEILVTMRLRVTLGVVNNVTSDTWIATTDSWDDTEWTEYTDETATIDGTNITMRWPWLGFTHGGTPYFDAPPYVNVFPTQWWGYRDGSGNNPIWNESTGAQLRSAVTGEEL
jgi:hypothetical protein